MKIVLVIILAVVAAAAVSVYADKRKMKQSARSLGLDAPGVRVIDCEGPMFRFAVKPEEGIVWVLSGPGAAPVSIPLEELAGCEFVDGGDKPFDLGTALVGSAAASALSGRKGGSVLRILRRDPDRPPAEYRLTRPTYREDFRRFARDVSALIEEYTEE